MWKHHINILLPQSLTSILYSPCKRTRNYVSLINCSTMTCCTFGKEITFCHRRIIWWGWRRMKFILNFRSIKQDREIRIGQVSWHYHSRLLLSQQEEQILLTKSSRKSILKLVKLQSLENIENLALCIEMCITFELKFVGMWKLL